ncbi:MAG: fructose-bisphosphate aldolase class I [Brachybacterium paraconglomeratum]|nr:fructose-bisphosphate aldolase class I [Brachybacterium paraconglomeratum]
MSASELDRTIRELVTPGRGILAADESVPTITRRFAPLGLEPSEENRRRYRQMLFTTPGVAAYISGVILFDETLRQRADDGRSFVEVLAGSGIVPGIKVDAGTAPLAGAPGEVITQGLDGLRERLAEYGQLGARFAKWRAVITIGDGRPTPYALDMNAHALGRYAALCQEAGLVPIVEPEVLMDGGHSLARCFEVTEATLAHLFAALRAQRVVLEHLLLKPNMVVPGADSPEEPSVEQVAEVTIQCLRRTVPAAVPGIVFLSGGQDARLATARLNAMNVMAPQPWPLSFSFARALQAPALAAWRGDARTVEAGQRAFYHRAHCNGAASVGRYTADMEQPEASPV